MFCISSFLFDFVGEDFVRQAPLQVESLRYILRQIVDQSFSWFFLNEDLDLRGRQTPLRVEGLRFLNLQVPKKRIFHPSLVVPMTRDMFLPEFSYANLLSLCAFYVSKSMCTLTARITKGGYSMGLLKSESWAPEGSNVQVILPLLLFSSSEGSWSRFLLPKMPREFAVLSFLFFRLWHGVQRKADAPRWEWIKIICKYFSWEKYPFICIVST